MDQAVQEELPVDFEQQELQVQAQEMLQVVQLSLDRMVSVHCQPLGVLLGEGEVLPLRPPNLKPNQVVHLNHHRVLRAVSSCFDVEVEPVSA